MTPPPPPPTRPPTIGDPPGAKWWSKGGPWSQPAPEPEPVDLHKPDVSSESGDQAAAETEPAGNDQAAEPQATGETDNDPRIWVSEFADNLAKRLGSEIGTILTETPEERANRQREEREAAYEAAEETDSQRKARHRREALARRHKADALWHQDHAERTKRFRRWCILTTLSASAGYAVHLPQALAHLPLPVGIGALSLAWAFDLKMRGWGHIRVTQVRGPAVLYLCLVRVPVASALVAVLGLAPLLALTGPHH
ncbi:hypothetical protein F7Q99_20090 [Streptomyces kaniharaensis]|uniref:Uncharacterized protein n=1 Tax=Streptomyces kaniharaensis TaxID=212423 RepID=A0A6N7KS89_9ACTN|nr:hypothetical protein [Streptomyces kaniharaensis]MQS14502.1 hypothetical protein [Streptomyces kaniharaensis]